MNDDLNLVITFLTKNKRIAKVALHIEHGLNNGKLKDWNYFAEEDVLENYKKLLPMHVVSDMDVILGVEEIFWIVNSKENNG